MIQHHAHSDYSTLAKKIWDRVDVQGPDDCWLWKLVPRVSGYGQFRNGRASRNLGAHQWAWILAYGDIPEGLFVCHHCDVRLCCNLTHLFLGTALDNNRDMVVERKSSL